MKNFEYKKICFDLLEELDARQKSIVSRRFALDQKEKETLESIGRGFGVCRERVRQIERLGLKKVQKKAEKYKTVFVAFANYLNSFGGFKKESALLEELGGKHKNEIFFLLSLKDSFERIKEDNDFYSLWTTDKKSFSQVKSTIDSLTKNLKDRKELISLKEIKKITSEKEKVLTSCLEVSKKIQKNDKGLYGLSTWPEINPKGVKDKAYLAFKETGKPLHFSQVSKLIKGSNVQTVHNELIKADKFVLVGRGIYALSEWGYRPGQIKDVITQALEEAGRPMEKNEILEKVLKQRMVKKNTVLLGLGDKNLFIKDSDGKYNIKSA